jgi:trimethylamine---corrinoid protein Co-methyltransferase
MATNGHRKITYQVLSEEELSQINDATLDLLEETGVQFTNDYVRQFFVDAGFRVTGKVVHFTKQQVEDAIRTAPQLITRQAFKAEYTFTKGDGGLYLSAGSWPLYVVEPETYARRQATYADLQKFTRLSDAMDNLIIANGVVKPCDVPEKVLHVVWSWNLLNNTYKVANTTHALTVQEAGDIIRVLSTACGSYKALKKTHAWTITCCLDQALIWGDTLVGAVEMAKAELPVIAMSMPLPGSMHPVTLAGTLVQANAEVLSAVVLTQLVNPGAPVIYTYYAGIMDMRVASHVFGAPEVALMHAAGAQLAKWYGLPCDMCSGHTDSKVPDAQAAAEKMLTMLPPALAGTDGLRLVAGELDFGLSASYEQMVIDNEMAGQVLRITRGIEVNKETLALDLIKKVGLGGNYLGERHTLNHFREELWLPQLFDRYGRDAWEARDSKDLLRRAQGRVADILEKHHPKPLDDNRLQSVADVVREICEREGCLDWWESVNP